MTVIARKLMAPDLDELVSVRRFVEGVATSVGLREDSAYDLKLAVSEACANAVEHAVGSKRPVEVLALKDDGTLTVTVETRGGFRMRSFSATDDRAHRGLGMPLMVALMDELSIRRLPDGGTLVRLTLFNAGRT